MLHVYALKDWKIRRSTFSDNSQPVWCCLGFVAILPHMSRSLLIKTSENTLILSRKYFYPYIFQYFWKIETKQPLAIVCRIITQKTPPSFLKSWPRKAVLPCKVTLVVGHSCAPLIIVLYMNPSGVRSCEQAKSLTSGLHSIITVILHIDMK